MGGDGGGRLYDSPLYFPVFQGGSNTDLLVTRFEHNSRSSIGLRKMFPFLRRYEIFTSSIPLTNHRPPFQVSRECTHSHFPLARNRIGIGSLYSPRNFFHSIHTFSISRHLLVDRSIDRFRESGRLETLLPRIFSSKLLGRLRYGTRLRNGR